MTAPRHDSPCPPLADADWPETIADLRAGFAGSLNVYRTMAHRPSLLKAWAPLRRHLVEANALGPALSEVAILRAGHRLQSAYEWAHHVSRARQLGFDDARIESIRHIPQGTDALIVGAVDALLDRHALGPDQEAELADAIGRDAVFDLIALVGFYSVLGALLETYATPLDERIQQEAEGAPALFALATAL
ncbi:carboxymuconolactone decarboxylase family protein [Salinicola aestuarinus]|uniref:carboxymuconolactone decarboxylase family protein n=1 Tax=Salinicola aestuarinus TaxID=1949082 RepID=UPI000DA11D64|nr:carboxymuconolactone decarboxylase family protein [Salinicola aestuarinus]